MDGAVKPLVDAGKLKILAVTDTRRDPRFPQVPTVVEAGLAGYEQVSWLALFAPAGTPPEIVARLNKALVDAGADPAVRARFAELGMTPLTGSSADLQKRVSQDGATFRKIASDLKIKLE
jgi:tripartite-type tricarboxylate transporter receptor subunit TctC